MMCDSFNISLDLVCGCFVEDFCINAPWWSSGRLLAFCAGDVGSTPGQGTKIPYAALCSQKRSLGSADFTG